jgi:transposase
MVEATRTGTMSKRQRRTFNAEFKLQIAQMIRDQGVSMGEGAI